VRKEAGPRLKAGVTEVGQPWGGMIEGWGEFRRALGTGRWSASPSARSRSGPGWDRTTLISSPRPWAGVPLFFRTRKRDPGSRPGW